MQLALVQSLANAAGEPETLLPNNFAVCIADPVRSKVSKTGASQLVLPRLGRESERRHPDKPDRWAARIQARRVELCWIIPPLILALRK